MTATDQIKGGEVLLSDQGIESFQESWKRICVPHCLGIQTAVVHTETHAAVLLPHKNKRCVQAAAFRYHVLIQRFFEVSPDLFIAVGWDRSVRSVVFRGWRTTSQNPKSSLFSKDVAMSTDEVLQLFALRSGAVEIRTDEGIRVTGGSVAGEFSNFVSGADYFDITLTDVFRNQRRDKIDTVR